MPSRDEEGVYVRDDGQVIPPALLTDTVDAFYAFGDKFCPARRDEEEEESGERGEGEDSDEDTDEVAERATQPISIGQAFDTAFANWLKTKVKDAQSYCHYY